MTGIIHLKKVCFLIGISLGVFYFSSCHTGVTTTDAALIGSWRIITWEQRGISSGTGTVHFSLNNRYKIDGELTTILGSQSDYTEKGDLIYQDLLTKSFTFEKDTEGTERDCTYSLTSTNLILDTDEWTLTLVRTY